MQKPIIVSLLEIVGGGLSIIAAGKIAKDEHEKKKAKNREWVKNNQSKRADIAADNIIKYNKK